MSEPRPGWLRAHFPALIPTTVHGPGKQGDRGGGFYTDRAQQAAATVTDREAWLLYRAVSLLQPPYILEIGAYVGYSTAHLAYAAPGIVWTVDPFTEFRSRQGEHNAKLEGLFWEHLRAAGLSDKVALVVDRSPECLPAISPPGGWDFVFIDGWHQGEQPRRDVRGVVAVSHPRTVIAMHDTWIPDVAAAYDELLAQGWNTLALPTPGALAFCWLDPPDGWAEFVKEKD